MCLFFPVKKHVVQGNQIYGIYAIYFSNLKSESRDQMNVGKVQSVHIFALSDQSWCFDVGVLPFSSIFLPSNFALCFTLFHICTIFCPYFLPSTKMRARARTKNEGKI